MYPMPFQAVVLQRVILVTVALSQKPWLHSLIVSSITVNNIPLQEIDPPWSQSWLSLSSYNPTGTLLSEMSESSMDKWKNYCFPNTYNRLWQEDKFNFALFIFGLVKTFYFLSGRQTSVETVLMNVPIRSLKHS